MCKSVKVRHTCSVLDMVCYHSIHLFVYSTAEPLLILAMKVTMTVLHKMSTVLHSLLDSPQSLEGGSMIASIVWPESLAEESDEGKSHWIQQQLQHIHSYCEKLLQTGMLRLLR